MKKIEGVELKEKFLEDSNYAESTKIYIRYILQGKETEKLENKVGKDLCQFNLFEIKELLGNFMAVSVNSIQKNKDIISKYIDYAKANNYISNENFCDDITEEDLQNFVWQIKAESKYINKEDFDYICEYVCLNGQDKAMLWLLWEGIKGEKGVELINLQTTDVDFKSKTIKVHGENEREIQVSMETIKAIEDALRQKRYESYENEGTRAKLRDLNTNTPHILRKGTKTGDKIAFSTLWNRIKTIRKEAGFPFITLDSIWWSGLFYKAYKIIESNGELLNEDIKKIMRIYGCPDSRQYKHIVTKKIKEYIDKIYNK